MKNRMCLLFCIAAALACVSSSTVSHGAWIWTRETGRFRNVNDITKENAAKQLQYAESFEAKNDFKGALREYKKTIKHFPTSPDAATAMFKMGVCYENLDKPDSAFKVYQQLLEKYPSFPDPEEVLRRQYAIAKEYYEGKRRPFPFLKVRLFKARGAAIDYLSNIVEVAPYSDLAANAKLNAGELQQRKSLFDEAIESYQFVIEQYPNTPAAETALFQVASCYYEKALRARYDEKSISLANTNFKSYIEKYPDGKYVKESRDRVMSLDEKKAQGAFEVGRFYEKKKAFQSALMYYKEVLQRHPLSAWAVKAEERIKVLEKRGVLEKADSAKAS